MKKKSQKQEELLAPLLGVEKEDLYPRDLTRLENEKKKKGNKEAPIEERDTSISTAKVEFSKKPAKKSGSFKSFFKTPAPRPTTDADFEKETYTDSKGHKINKHSGADLTAAHWLDQSAKAFQFSLSTAPAPAIPSLPSTTPTATSPVRRK